VAIAQNALHVSRGGARGPEMPAARAYSGAAGVCRIGGRRGRKLPPRRSRSAPLICRAGAPLAATPECRAGPVGVAGGPGFEVRIGGEACASARRTEHTAARSMFCRRGQKEPPAWPASQRGSAACQPISCAPRLPRRGGANTSTSALSLRAPSAPPAHRAPKRRNRARPHGRGPILGNPYPIKGD
jgi:hypothetical protein